MPSINGAAPSGSRAGTWFDPSLACNATRFRLQAIDHPIYPPTEEENFYSSKHVGYQHGRGLCSGFRHLEPQDVEPALVILQLLLNQDKLAEVAYETLTCAFVMLMVRFWLPCRRTGFDTKYEP